MRTPSHSSNSPHSALSVHMDELAKKQGGLRGQEAQRRVEQLVGGIGRRGFLQSSVAGAAILLFEGCANKDRTSRDAKEGISDIQEATEHINRSEVKWVPASVLLEQGQMRCIDGRDCTCAACTPGGDIGDFVLGMAAVQKISGKPFTDKEVQKALGLFLKSYHKGAFYQHSDHHAFSHWARELGVDEEELKGLLINPKNKDSAIKKSLTKPENVGCGHLKLMLKFPGAYYEKDAQNFLGLVQQILVAYQEARWRKDHEMDHVVLDGEHKEKAALLVNVETKVDRDTPLPLIQPHVINKGDTEYFVVHPQVEELSQQRWLNVASYVTGRKVDQRALDETMRAMRPKFLGASKDKLAPEAKILSVDFKPDPRRKTFTVRESA